MITEKEKYDFCLKINCVKFRETEDRLLKESESVFDAVEDMEILIEDCCKTCKFYEQACNRCNVKDV